MPGNLYFYREDDIILLRIESYIGSPGIVPDCLGVGSTEAIFIKFFCKNYNIDK